MARLVLPSIDHSFLDVQFMTRNVCFEFQLFAANRNKPPEIVTIFVANRNKLLRFLADFKTDKGNSYVISFSTPYLERLQ